MSDWRRSAPTPGGTRAVWRANGAQMGGLALCAAILLIEGATPARAGTTTYLYDDAGRLRQVTYANSTTTTYTLDAAGNRVSVVTAVDSTPPTVPTGLTATAPSSTQVNLSWSASTDPGGGVVASYRMYRGGTLLGTSPETTYTDATTVGSTTYSYTVASVDGAGNASAQSTAASVTTPDTIAPTVPSGLAGSVVSATQINLSWGASTDSGGSGLAGYRVYRNGTQVSSRTVTSYSDTGLTPGTTYSYSIKAYDVSGNVSAASATVTPKTYALPAAGRNECPVRFCPCHEQLCFHHQRTQSNTRA